MRPTRPSAIWFGETLGTEFGPLCRRMARAFELVVCPAAIDCESASATFLRGPPSLVVLAIDVPSRFAASDIGRLTARWPLSPILGVTSSLAEGRRRGGMELPGIREVPWYEADALLEWWSATDATVRGLRPTPPQTFDREEWLIASIDAAVGAGRPAHDRVSRARQVAVAANTKDAIGPLCDLVSAIGYPPVSSYLGAPPASVAADTVVWDTGGDACRVLAAVRGLAAARRDLSVVLLDSFPRGEVAAECLQAGAAGVLGRPVSLPALAALLGIEPAGAALEPDEPPAIVPPPSSFRRRFPDAREPWTRDAGRSPP